MEAIMLLRCVLRTVLWILFVILLSVVVIMANPGPISGKVPYKMTVKATAYTIHDPGMNGRGLTSRGGYARPWYTVAVDPRVIPLGSRLYIPALAATPSGGWFVADDTGGAIKGKRIDICSIHAPGP